MENKLQQLTQKLYDEGLEKGRAEAERLVAEAKTNAAKIVKEAEAQAAKILAEANTKAQDVEKNAMTEISLAGKQALSKIKAEISSMIIAKSTAPAVKAATLDPEFVKQTHATCIAGGNPFENLLDDRPGIEALGIGIERILPQSGYQTVVILVEHGARLKRYTAFYRPCRAGTPSTERRNPGPKTKCSSRRLWHPP